MTNWSSYQTAVFDDVARGEGHTVVRARAGSGKTTTIVESMRHLPPFSPALMVAFNKSIATELKRRAPADVDVKTVHGHGYAALRKAVRGVSLNDEGRFDQVAAPMLNDRFRQSRAAMKRLISLAKNTLASTIEDLDDLVDGYDIDVPDCFSRPAFLQVTLDVLSAMKRGWERNGIDFDDMIWLPVVCDLPTEQYGHVFVDETQDLNAAQLELVLRSVMANGRITAIGDDRQAIYGFRGAGGKQSMDRIIDGLGAKVLPLSVTYRCPRVVVDLAKKIVPDLEAAPGAEMGTITESDWGALRKQVLPGDFVISRFNAPLIHEVLQFVQEGRRACMLGRDYGKMLGGLIIKSKRLTVDDFIVWLQDWEATEVARLTDKGSDTTMVRDRASALWALCEGTKNLQEVMDRIDSFFANEPDGNTVVFCSTHKAKGLENKRVFLFSDTYARAFAPEPDVDAPWAVQANQRRGATEEKNLWYVAVTRCAQDLFLATGVK